MSKLVKVTAAMVPTSWGRRTDHKLVNHRMNKRSTASDERQKEKITEQGDVIESGVSGHIILDRTVREGIYL